ncbi:MAG: hypothetical protein AB1779_04870 [Candidatus Thermoplasmatota archaeon]
MKEIHTFYLEKWEKKDKIAHVYEVIDSTKYYNYFADIDGEMVVFTNLEDIPGYKEWLAEKEAAEKKMSEKMAEKQAAIEKEYEERRAAEEKRKKEDQALWEAGLRREDYTQEEIDFFMKYGYMPTKKKPEVILEWWHWLIIIVIIVIIVSIIGVAAYFKWRKK